MVFSGDFLSSAETKGVSQKESCRSNRTQFLTSKLYHSGQNCQENILYIFTADEKAGLSGAEVDVKLGNSDRGGLRNDSADPGGTRKFLARCVLRIGFGKRRRTILRRFASQA
jgi:hypothetical protein